MEITFRNGMHYLAGCMDENAEFDSLLGAHDPIRLNIGGIKFINSVGVRKLLSFTLKFAPKKIEYYECTPDFIANANVIPQLLGDSNNGAKVVSFYVPYTCENCRRNTNLLLQTDSFTSVDDITLPQQRCDKCQSEMELDLEKDEYFYFLTRR